MYIYSRLHTCIWPFPPAIFKSGVEPPSAAHRIFKPVFPLVRRSLPCVECYAAGGYSCRPGMTTYDESGPRGEEILASLCLFADQYCVLNGSPVGFSARLNEGPVKWNPS